MSLPRSTLREALMGSIDAATLLACSFDVSRVDRHVDEIRISEVARAVEVGATHGLDLQVERRRRQQALRLEIEGFEDVEHCDERDAARTGRRHRHDVVALVSAFDRCAFLGLVSGEISLRDNPAVRLHLFSDAVGDPSFVEGVGAAVGDGTEGLGQVGLDEPIAFLPFAAARLPEGSDRSGKGSHRARHLAVEPACESCRHREALGEADRRRHDILPRQLAELLMRELHAPHRARARPARDIRPP